MVHRREEPVGRGRVALHSPLHSTLITNLVRKFKIQIRSGWLPVDFSGHTHVDGQRALRHCRIDRTLHQKFLAQSIDRH